MKTPTDPRHQRRRHIVQDLFAQSFHSQKKQHSETKEVISHLSEVDEKIKTAAPEWPLEKIGKVDLAILRLGVYELLFTEHPPKVVIDEAVELAKEFGGETSPGFINGVLGTILKNFQSPQINTNNPVSTNTL